MNEAPLIFVTGKGGVGKSAVAAALALREARRGRRTLLAELGETSFFEQWFSIPVGHQPVPFLDPNLSVCRWEPQACLREYLLHYLRVESLVDLFFENRVMRALVQAAPALREIALLGKITSGLRQVGPALPYDVIVVDAFATGHFKALMSAPRGLAQAVRFGPMGEQSRAMGRLLSDSQTAQYYVVSLAEELPVQEAVELHEFIWRDLHVSSHLILNRLLAIPESIRSMPSSKDPFLEFLHLVEERQNQSLQKLRIRGPVHILPQYFATTARELMPLMAKALEGV